MGSLLLRVRLFVSSYAPLFLILAIRFERRSLQVACGLIALGGVITLALLLRSLMKLNATPYKVERVSDQGPEVAGYVATYLLPFLTTAEPSLRDMIGYALFLLIVGIIYVRSTMVQVNPLLYLLGYRVNEITTSDDWIGFLISRSKPKIGDRLLVSRLLTTLALERPDAERLGPESTGRSD